MYKGLTIIFLALVAACQGHEEAIAESSSARHGESNVYYVYTRDNPRDPVQIFPTNSSILLTSIRFRALTAVIVHGHEGSAFNTLNPVVKDAFLTSADINVIVVDWSVYASQRYTNAVNAVPSVGRALAEFIQNLAWFNRVALDRLHLVGFNLGAHVIGFTGRALNGNVARITGLDPAASQWGSNSHRLRVTDARYVEVIHTDGSGLTSNGIGTAVGHVDFFVNGGSNQPGCIVHSCSHNRAWEVFAASLTHDHLRGNQCNTNFQVNMNLCRGFVLALGNNQLEKIGSGIFRANTGRRYPF